MKAGTAMSEATSNGTTGTKEKTETDPLEVFESLASATLFIAIVSCITGMTLALTAVWLFIEGITSSDHQYQVVQYVICAFTAAGAGCFYYAGHCYTKAHTSAISDVMMYRIERSRPAPVIESDTANDKSAIRDSVEPTDLPAG